MTASWVDGPMLSFDIESTGVDTATDRIVTASILHIEWRVSRATSWLLDPGIDIPQAAIDVHGITNERARAEGEEPALAILEIEARLTETWDHGIPVVIMNAPFDLSLLSSELQRHHDRPLKVTGPVLDPLVLDRHVDRYRSGKRTLTHLCAHYGITFTEAHTSDADALAAARLTWKIAKRFPKIGAMTLVGLQDAQADWYRESSHSFASYLRGKAATQCRREAEALSGTDRDTKLSELQELLTRADAVDRDADGWPLRSSHFVNETTP